MVPHPKLAKLQRLLGEYTTNFVDPNILCIADHPENNPFVYLIYEKSVPDKIVVSVSLDYQNNFNLAHFMLLLRTANLALGQSFYISPTTGQMLFGDAAHERFATDFIDLENLEAISKSLN